MRGRRAACGARDMENDAKERAAERTRRASGARKIPECTPSQSHDAEPKSTTSCPQPHTPKTTPHPQKPPHLQNHTKEKKKKRKKQHQLTVKPLRRLRDIRHSQIRREQDERERERSPRRGRRVRAEQLEQREERVERVHGDVGPRCFLGVLGMDACFVRMLYGGAIYLSIIGTASWVAVVNDRRVRFVRVCVRVCGAVWSDVQSVGRSLDERR